MSRFDRDTKGRANELWKKGSFLEAGRLLFEGLPKDEQPHWAAAILDLSVKWLDVRTCAVWELQRVARKRRRWRGAHQAFGMIRKATLRLEERKTRTQIQERILCQCYVAENVAKVIYNAADPMDPFDEDAGWWIVSCLKSCIDCVGKSEFEEEATSLLFGEVQPRQPGPKG